MTGKLIPINVITVEEGNECHGCGGPEKYYVPGHVKDGTSLLSAICDNCLERLGYKPVIKKRKK